MTSLAENLKIGVVLLFRSIFRLFWIFPIKTNRVFFISWNGKSYSCNPKYIFEYMYKHSNERFEYVWCLDDRESFPSCFKNVKFVKFHGFLYHYYILTSKVYFGNAGISVYLPIRRDQIIINTWHGGGAYKKIGLANSTNNKRYIQFVLTTTSKELTFFISSCSRFSEIMSIDYFIDKRKFMPTGMPRNDIFFSPTESQRIKVLDDLQINKDYGILLYAPTYRGSIDKAASSVSLDIPTVLGALEKRFSKKFKCLYRRHSFFLQELNIAVNQNIVDVSSQPDMQELLCASDVLITDYSSSMWDFSLTGKPCFLYAPDLDEYKAERDFYTPFDKLPFPYGKSNDELAKAILSFDNERYKNAVKGHRADLGSYEEGNACGKIYELVKRKLER